MIQPYSLSLTKGTRKGPVPVRDPHTPAHARTHPHMPAHTRTPWLPSKQGKESASEQAGPGLEDPGRRMACITFCRIPVASHTSLWLGNVVSCWVVLRLGKRGKYFGGQLATSLSEGKADDSGSHKFSVEGTSSKRPAVYKIKGERPRSEIPTSPEDVIWKHPCCVGKANYMGKGAFG